MVIKKSELRQMIREALREELQKDELNEAAYGSPESQREDDMFSRWLNGRRIVDEDGIMSSLDRDISDCIGNVFITINREAENDKEKYTRTAGNHNWNMKRTTSSHDQISVYTYRLATGIAEADKNTLLDPSSLLNSDLKDGFKKLKNYQISHLKGLLKLEHELYCEKEGSGYTLYYRLSLIPDWDKCVLWSNSYPSRMRGQTPKDVRMPEYAKWTS